MNVGSTEEKPRDVSSKSDSGQVLESVQDQLVAEGVKPEKAGRIALSVISTMSARFHSGPLPPVELFQGYEAVCKGSARDLVDMAIRQQKHSNAVGKIDAYCGLILPLAGMCAAVSVIGGMLWAAFQLAMNGHEWIAGVAIAGTSFAAIVGQFLQRDKKLPEAPTRNPVKPKRKRA